MEKGSVTKVTQTDDSVLWDHYVPLCTGHLFARKTATKEIIERLMTKQAAQ
jgi:hypothetical protein